MALTALLAATGPGVAGYFIDTGIPAVQLLANALTVTALAVHLGARCRGGGRPRSLSGIPAANGR